MSCLHITTAETVAVWHYTLQSKLKLKPTLKTEPMAYTHQFHKLIRDGSERLISTKALITEFIMGHVVLANLTISDNC